MEWVNLVVFFFQAEDGIRDSSVTGVQTCALPILLRRGLRRLGRFRVGVEHGIGQPKTAQAPESTPQQRDGTGGWSVTPETLGASRPEIGRASGRERVGTWDAAQALGKKMTGRQCR